MSDANPAQRALAALPPHQSGPIALALYAGLTSRQIAAALEIPEAAVRTDIRHGLAALRLRLDEDRGRGQGSKRRRRPITSPATARTEAPSA